METFHEMIAVDCYCCGVWPSILCLNVWGWALREQRSRYCTTAQITTWTGSSSAQSSARSRSPLKYPRQQSHCGDEYERGSAQNHGQILPSQWSPSFFFFSLYNFKDPADDKEVRLATHRKHSSGQGDIPSFFSSDRMCWKCIIN